MNTQGLSANEMSAGDVGFGEQSGGTPHAMRIAIQAIAARQKAVCADAHRPKEAVVPKENSMRTEVRCGFLQTYSES